MTASAAGSGSGSAIGSASAPPLLSRRQALESRLAVARESFGIAIASLRSNKLRASLTTLGIVIGIVTVVLMITLIQGLNKAFMGEVEMLGSHTLYVQKFPWIIQGDFFRYRNRPNVTMREAEKLAEQVPGLVAVVPHVTTAKSVRYRDRFSRRVFLTGTTADHPRIANLEVTEGRFLSPEDVRYRRFHCVIGPEVADRFFPEGRAEIGARLMIGGYPFRVIGVLDKRGSMFGENMDNIIYVPIGTLMRCFGRYRSLDIGVRVPGGEEMGGEGGAAGSEGGGEVITADAAAGDLSLYRDEIQGTMRRIRGLRPGQGDNFSVNEQTALTNMYRGITSGVYAGGIGIAGIALLVGGIGIMNIMMVSVVERTREIGIRKAIGAPRRVILGQFLTEAVILCLVGGVIGIALAGGLALLIDRVTPLPMRMPPWVIAFALAFSSLVGLSFGLLPAHRAARVDPIEALRYE